MKKFLVFAFIMIGAILTVTADDAGFTRAIRNCTPFSDSGSVTTDNVSAQSVKKIIGWQDNKCTYKEQINYAGMNIDVVCRFSRPQLEEIASVMESYALLQKYSDTEPDTSSLEAVQNNPVVKVWNKYMQNQSVCTMSGVQ